MPITRLSPEQLRLRVDPAQLPPDTAALVDEALPWIGQQRAAQAARFGLRILQPDYHLFVLGEVGSGRSTLLLQMMAEEAARRPVPPDLCYLHNVEAPEQPLALRLPAGEGRLLRTLMQEFAQGLQREIPKRLAAPDVKSECERLASRARAEEDTGYAALSAFAEARRFSLVRDEGRLIFTLRDESGQPLTADKALGLDREQQGRLDAAEDELRLEIARFLEQSREREQRLGEALLALRRQLLKPLLEQLLQPVRQAMRKQIKDAVKLGRYFEQLLVHLLANLGLFQSGDEDEQTRRDALERLLARLRVNIVVDHHDSRAAPVLRDDNPLFRELFGSIDYQSEDDVLLTDFSRIRAGSLLKAHGGFLMLHLRDLLADEQVWEKLRRFLRSGRLQIEEPGMLYAPSAAVSLKPEAVDVDVKLVLIASVEEFYQLQEADPEFARRFRCKVDFADAFEASEPAYRAMAVFVSHCCARLGLPHLTAAAVAAVIEQGHREAEDQRRLSALFGRSEALLIEAAALASEAGRARVEAEDVAAALQARIERHNYPEQQMQEAISDGERLLLVDGQRVGQINGLTVVELGDYEFGFPVRVTASTHAGDEGLLNIEREVEMSGPIHDKGVLILHSYLSALFGHLAPLALNAAVVFEQEYNGVEGDSASCAEFYALLSALSGVPLRQDLAVTGALNQHGEVLPVGGINEKIEGFFLSCQRQGLNGRQGVLIPERNRRHLMLSPALIEAARQGLFHVYTVSSAAAGMSLLTGMDFGELCASTRSYPPHTVLGRAQQTLQDYRRACGDAEAGGKGSALRGAMPAASSSRPVRWPAGQRGPRRKP
ncbi:ATP-binding protein [Paucibacter sp. APW11]|uniref:endopeptidase La n=1 Tax=Roseateles aquae TaxID=3077235 RepID=A0ABU3PE87_9BURK|nr:ATP-binding protein [Paucibacter sp. APW11]MDT9000418.1 ATP-binding protein [Paucibacter sp. APW11]